MGAQGHPQKCHLLVLGGLLPEVTLTLPEVLVALVEYPLISTPLLLEYPQAAVEALVDLPPPHNQTVLASSTSVLREQVLLLLLVESEEHTTSTTHLLRLVVAP